MYLRFFWQFLWCEFYLMPLYKLFRSSFSFLRCYILCPCNAVRIRSGVNGVFLRRIPTAS